MNQQNNMNPELPMGFAMALAMQPNAMQNYANLSTGQQSEILSRAKTVQSKSEMQSLVNSLN
ncbi:hypothetical protein ACS3UN_04375 [Oscillospiraceae bacterium LTW-04]|nr:hypothetical protein RBH76_06090 [Oscillospiraceae bacterium MB24-C1]